MPNVLIVRAVYREKSWEGEAARRQEASTETHSYESPEVRGFNNSDVIGMAGTVGETMNTLI